MGRPSKLTPETADRICELIRAGNTIDVAAGAAGASDTTFYRWMRLGAAGREPFRAFRASVEVAQANAQVMLVEAIARAALGEAVPVQRRNGEPALDAEGHPMFVERKPQWRAAIRLLERRFPERWGLHRGSKLEMPARRECPFTSVFVDAPGDRRAVGP